MDTNNATTLRVGDRVQLREGGSPMYVAGLSPNMAYCSWVDEDDGSVRQGTFHRSRLVESGSSLTPKANA